MKIYKRFLRVSLGVILFLIGAFGYKIWKYDKRNMDCMRTVMVQSHTEREDYYAPCHVIYDEEMYEDEVAVFCMGQAGVRENTSLVTYVNGRVMTEQAVETSDVIPAIAKVIKVGKKARPKFIMPVQQYTVTSLVGPRWGTTHNGVDLAVPEGSLVRSTAAGTVIQAGENGGYGISVYVDHGDNMISRYGHLSKALVQVGDVVEQGQCIGLSGNTGRSTGPHLHFELRVEDVPVNPLEYVGE